MSLVNLIIPIVILGIVIIAIKASFSTMKEQKKKAGEIASLLGLRIEDAFSASEQTGQISAVRFGRAAKSSISEEEKEFAKAMKGPFGNYMAAFMPWRICGDYKSVGVSIRKVERGSGKSKRSYTRFESNFKRPLEFSLTISSEDFFTRVGKSLFGLQDIETGNSELDRLARIKSDNVNGARSWLSSSGRQQALISLLMQHPEAEINQAGVALESRGFKPDLNEYRAALDALTSCVERLGQG
jgi:hypothetical protein